MKPRGMDIDRHDTGVSGSDIRDQLDRILASPEFRASPRRRELLRYLVEEALAGRRERIKGYSIGLAVFGRNDGFDPQIDPIVRLEAGRLRRDLEHYYLTAGQRDPVMVLLPKRGYAPEFTTRRGGGPQPAFATAGIPPPDVGTATDSTPPHAPAASDADSGAHESGKDRRRGPLFLKPATAFALLVGVVLSGAGTYLWFSLAAAPRVDVSGSPPVAAAPHARASIAVAPFSAASGAETDRYFAAGLSQELARSLMRFPDLAIVPPSSMKAAIPAGFQTMRHGLGVSHLVEGDVAKTADEIRIVARLVDLGSGRLLWAESYRRELRPDRIFEIEEDIARRIATIIGSSYGVITHRSLASPGKPPGNLASLDCVLRYYRYQLVMGADNHARVRDCLEEAVARDPDYATAWASLSNVYAQEGRLGFNPRSDAAGAFERARDAASRAIELKPDDATAHLMLANVYFDVDDFAAFRRTSDEALRLSPWNPDILAHYGIRLAFHGEWQRGLDLLNRAIDISPQHPSWYHAPVLLNHYLEGDFDRAMEEAGRIDPMSVMGQDFYAAMILGQSGRVDEARVAAANLQRKNPKIVDQFWLSMRVWKFQPDAIERLADGLRKAGVPVGQSPGQVGAAPATR